MPPGIYRLPLELVRKVAAESCSRDLAALALTGRHFHAWVNPCLYEHNIKHQNAHAAVWAAARGRLDTLLRLDGAKTRSSKPFINKTWRRRFWYGQLLPLPLPRRFPLAFTLLHLAAQGGHDDVISWLIQQGADVNTHSTNVCRCDPFPGIDLSWTPLHFAICHCQEKTVKLLLSNQAALRTNDRCQIEALHTAAAKGLTSTIRHLSTLPGFSPNVKDVNGRTALHHAVQEGENLDAIQTLLGVGADIQGACGAGPPFLHTPLWIAVAHGDLEVAAMLLQAGAKPFAHNDRDRKKVAPFRQQLRRRQRELRTSLLQVTLQKGSSTANSGRHGVLQRKVIRALLDFGCDINENLIIYGPCGEVWNTPLTLAVRDSSSTTVRLLLERGAEVNAKDIRESALYCALSERASASLAERVDKVTALLEHGADLLDQSIINELIILRSSRTMVDAVADNLGPENLTDSKIPRVLAICRVFQERKIYDSIKRYAQAQHRATDRDIQYALEMAARSRRACVPASLDEVHLLLDEMRPGLTVDTMLDQWRDELTPCLVEWLEEINGPEGSE